MDRRQSESEKDRALNRLLSALPDAPLPSGFEARFEAKLRRAELRHPRAMAAAVAAWASDLRIPTPAEASLALVLALALGAGGGVWSYIRSSPATEPPHSLSEIRGMGASAFPAVYDALIHGGSIR